jgi:hypothetical protein
MMHLEKGVAGDVRLPMLKCGKQYLTGIAAWLGVWRCRRSDSRLEMKQR